MTATATDGQHSLVVEASSQDCAADHEGASFECSIAQVGDRMQIETVFQDGKDPNGACAGPLTTTCTLEVEAGSLTVEFNGEQIELVVPNNERVCLPG